MADHRPTWQLAAEAAEHLTASDRALFKLADLIEYVQRLDSSRGRGSIQPVVQAMTSNAGAGPAQPCGKVFVRVDHGYYRLRDGSDAIPVDHNVARAASGVRRRARLLSEAEALLCVACSVDHHGQPMP